MDILNKIQRGMKAPKNQKNTFGNYNYRSCEDILEAVKPFLDKAIITLNDEIVVIGARFYVKATATITEGDKSVSVSAYARESEEKKGMDSAQITGAASSYARKYALNGLFCIDDTKDADANTNGAEKVTLDQKQSSQILDYIDNNNIKKDRFLAYMKADKVENILKTDFDKAIKALEIAIKQVKK